MPPLIPRNSGVRVTVIVAFQVVAPGVSPGPMPGTSGTVGKGAECILMRRARMAQER